MAEPCKHNDRDPIITSQPLVGAEPDPALKEMDAAPSFAFGCSRCLIKGVALIPQKNPGAQGHEQPHGHSPLTTQLTDHGLPAVSVSIKMCIGPHPPFTQPLHGLPASRAHKAPVPACNPSLP